MASLIYEQIIFTQLTDQPLALFERGHFTKVPLIMVGDNLIATTHCLNNRLISGYKHCWRDPVRVWNYGLWSSGKICVPLHNFTISRFLLREGGVSVWSGVATGRAPNGLQAVVCVPLMVSFATGWKSMQWWVVCILLLPFTRACGKGHSCLLHSHLYK